MEGSVLHREGNTIKSYQEGYKSILFTMYLTLPIATGQLFDLQIFHVIKSSTCNLIPFVMNILRIHRSGGDIFLPSDTWKLSQLISSRTTHAPIPGCFYVLFIELTVMVYIFIFGTLPDSKGL